MKRPIVFFCALVFIFGCTNLFAQGSDNESSASPQNNSVNFGIEGLYGSKLSETIDESADLTNLNGGGLQINYQISSRISLVGGVISSKAEDHISPGETGTVGSSNILSSILGQIISPYLGSVQIACTGGNTSLSAGGGASTYQGPFPSGSFSLTSSGLTRGSNTLTGNYTDGYAINGETVTGNEACTFAAYGNLPAPDPDPDPDPPNPNPPSSSGGDSECIQSLNVKEMYLGVRYHFIKPKKGGWDGYIGGGIADISATLCNDVGESFEKCYNGSGMGMYGEAGIKYITTFGLTIGGFVHQSTAMFKLKANDGEERGEEQDYGGLVSGLSIGYTF